MAIYSSNDGNTMSACFSYSCPQFHGSTCVLLREAILVLALCTASCCLGLYCVKHHLVPVRFALF
eukprot:COSAG02_NODE_3091_length_7386_cov_7.913682_7_plen_65_part_00